MMQELEFHKISTEDRIWMTEKFKEEQPEACEYTFVNNFIWRKSYGVEVARICGCGLIRYHGKKSYRYSYPFGNGDKKAVIEALLLYCHEGTGDGYKLDLCPITEKQRKELIEWFPGQFEIEADRDDFDYVYLKDDLASLRGKKYHGKRNHIARFMDRDDWEYETLTAENIQECRDMSREWLTFKEDKLEEEDKLQDGVEDENIALHEALDYYEEFGLVGGLLRKEGKVVAFTIGEPLNDETMVVHFEKAYPNLQGAYPMINQQFILHECKNYKYVNREEDVGDAGLRKAKLSYYPEILLKKYCAVESSIVFANENDLEQIKLIWKTCFEDEDKYIEFYLKNRFETENMLVIHEDGKPVSMASFLPLQLKQGEEWIPARYVYAVATLPEYRGKGLAAEILQYGFEKYKEPLLLQPETEELKKYYERLGFINSFEKREWEIPWEDSSEKDSWKMPQDVSGERTGDILCALSDCEDVETAAEVSPEWSGAFNRGKEMSYEMLAASDSNKATSQELQAVSNGDNEASSRTLAASDIDKEASHNDDGTGNSGKVTPEEYKEIRDAHFDGDGYVSWDKEAIQYALLENDFCGGFAKKTGQDVILYKEEKDVLRVIETTLEGEALQAQIQKLLSETHSTKAVYENKAGMIKYPQGMEMHRNPKGKGYLNLTLG